MYISTNPSTRPPEYPTNDLPNKNGIVYFSKSSEPLRYLANQNNGGPDSRPTHRCLIARQSGQYDDHCLAIARNTILRSSEASSTNAARQMHSTHAIGLSATVPNGPLRNGT